MDPVILEVALGIFIIKDFRSFSCDRNYSTVNDCKDDFLKFLQAEKWRNPESELIANAHLMASRVEFVLQDLEFDGKIDFREKVIAESDRLREALCDNSIAMSRLTYKVFVENFYDIICKFANELSGNVITKAVGTAISKYAYEYYRRSNCASGYETGVVFLGYGSEELYPVVEEIIYDGRLEGTLRQWTYRQADLNGIRRSVGVIISFAQQDMTQLFMEGISKQYIAFFLGTLEGLLSSKTEYLLKNWVPDDQLTVETALREKEDEQLAAEVRRAFQKMRQDEVISPLMQTIRALPREEMVAMAEAFVELTSMRRKVDSTLQTVGGPVDVAFISKGDGFTWIKRKMYFDPGINDDYFKRRKRVLSGA